MYVIGYFWIAVLIVLAFLHLLAGMFSKAIQIIIIAIMIFFLTLPKDGFRAKESGLWGPTAKDLDNHAAQVQRNKKSERNQ
jgi:hypothetical protein